MGGVEGGRGAQGSKRFVDEHGLAGEVVDESTLSAQGAKKSSGGAQDVTCAASHEGVIVGGWAFDQGVLEHEGTLESEQSGVGDVEVDDVGSDEQSMEVVDGHGHRFRAGAGGFGFGDWAKTSRKSFSSR